MRWLAISVSLLLASAFSAAARPKANARKPAAYLRGRTAHRAAARPAHSAAPLRKASPRRQATASTKSSSKTSSASAKKPAAKKAAAKTPASRKKVSAKRRVRRAPRRFVLRQKAPTPARIREIQSALARSGYYQGDPNGKWDHTTVAALEKFQTDNGLDSTGKLDARSLQKLGLGSDIAGMAAPKPPATISAPAPAGSITAPSPAGTLAPAPVSVATITAPADPGTVAAPGKPNPTSKSSQSGDPGQSGAASAAKSSEATTPH